MYLCHQLFQDFFADMVANVAQPADMVEASTGDLDDVRGASWTARCPCRHRGSGQPHTRLQTHILELIESAVVGILGDISRCVPSTSRLGASPPAPDLSLRL